MGVQGDVVTGGVMRWEVGLSSRAGGDMWIVIRRGYIGIVHRGAIRPGEVTVKGQWGLQQ